MTDGNEDAAGCEPTASEGEPQQQGESMATQVMEVNAMPEHHQARALVALARLRLMIATALRDLGREAESPRWIEASLRLNPIYQSVTHLEEVKQLTVSRDVHDTVGQLDANWSPSTFEAWCEGLRIPLDAYIDVYEQLGMLPKTELSDVAKRYVP